MKKLIKFATIAIVGLSFTSTSYASWYGYSTPNVFGGYNYNFSDGSYMYSTPNVFGGYNYYGW